MKSVTPLLFFISILIGCVNQPKNNFAICFANVDTSKTGQSIGCAAGTYKLINNKYVLRIIPDFPIQFDNCYNVNIDTSSTKGLIELLVFDNNDANLSNICTDVIMTNNPAPTRQLYAQSGQLIIGFSDPTEYYGNQTHHTTILIKKLVFIDDKTGQKIEFDKELIWKVLDTGMPG